MSCRKCTTQKKFAYIQQRVNLREQSRAPIALFIAIILFSRIKSFPQNLCSRSSKNSSSVSKLDPRNLVLNLKNQNSKPEPRFLILENFRGLRIEFRVETVNLHLSSTVTCYLTCHKKIAKVQCSGTIETMLNYNPQLSVPQLLPCYLVTTKLLKSGCINGVEVFEGFFK